MTVLLTDGDKGLFDILGTVFNSQVTVNTAAGTTVPAEVAAILAKFNELTGIDFDIEQTISGLPGGLQSWQGSSRGLSVVLSDFAQQYLTQVVAADVDMNQPTLEAALRELIRQMIDSGTIANPDDDVDASTVGGSASAAGGNEGDGVMVVSVLRGDGQANQNVLAETLVAEVASDGGQTAASLDVSGQATKEALAADWPGGSGASTTLSAISAASSLLLNGDMEDEDDRADSPDNWIVSLGTIGTTLKMTNVEQQTIAIAGTPTSGSYVLTYTNLASKAQSTAPIAFDAAASAVQAALRLLEGLSLVTVTSTGSSPNFTHTVVFNGAGGNQTQLTSTNTFDTGTITHATTVSGSASVYAGGKALEFDSNGSQLTAIQQRITNLQAGVPYAFCGWFLADVVPAAGVITVDLYDGSAIIADDMGNNNSFTIDCTALSTSFDSRSGVFRLPRVVPPVVYLRIRISTAVTNTSSIFIDHCSLAQMTELYIGGPLAAVFSGADNFAKGDKFTITITNDRAGAIQEWFERNFQMRAKGLQLPSDTSAGETIPDSLIT